MSASKNRSTGKPFWLIAVSLAQAIWLGACSDTGEGVAVDSQATKETTTKVSRWYSAQQVARGGPLFQQHCAACHKQDASGSPNWKEVNEQGKLPPPPLNGTAHAWHHPLPLLRRIVRLGGIPMGGSMPPFKDKLDASQIDAILAWVQSHWPDKIYATWHQIDQKYQSQAKQ